jgi:RHS repeat-associated protein
LIQNGVEYKIIHDQLGSVRLVVNAMTGAIASRIDYDEFGRITSSIAPDFQPLGFAGGLRDAASNLVRFGVRDYDPSLGRWTAKDPILFEGGDSNLYGYVMQDPINYFDSSGLFRTGDFLACMASNPATEALLSFIKICGEGFPPGTPPFWSCVGAASAGLSPALIATTKDCADKSRDPDKPPTPKCDSTLNCCK